ncbi:hypothetical protein HMPREF3034_00222 [Prevotella sp. DNF00663]|uniref:ChaN family lipoprotein n=1 Tax=unclassified Prevotella TaxID=2638335 RepID=UPI000512B0AD|nr:MULTISPECIES: ChaN family lipoprotein [unclassified Prevotella]KGI61335.1 hypothetical protein HMPREF0671_00825 [Prevotella sp. S7 MS 2]KXB85370.1 hypothetical protein HMPREF3034_00222 [Prevotella sp. DNF00663]
MKKKYLLLLLLVMPLLTMAKSDLKAFTLVDNAGHEVPFQEMIKQASKSDVVFVGEMHNCPITHWLELKIAEALYAKHKDNLMLGAEMYEADNQLIMDEYLNGNIKYEQFTDEMRLWPNYETDYEPVFSFAEENHLRFIATNVPRRYANVVKYHGLDYLDSLSADAKKYLPPLPIPFTMEGKSTAAFSLMASIHGKKDDPIRMHMAQALKDATMAWNISKNIGRHHFLHFNGSYHTAGKTGIIDYLNRYRPETTITTIMAVKQEEIDKLDSAYQNQADYYIIVPQDMSTSY